MLITIHEKHKSEDILERVKEVLDKKEDKDTK